MNTKFKLFLTAVFAVAVLSLSSNSVWAAKMEGSHGKMESSRGMMEDQGSSKVAIHGFCPVCVIHGKMMKGSDNFVSEYKGVVYKFPGIDQQKMFLDNPEKYVADLDAKFQALKEESMKKDGKMMEGSH